MHYQGTDLLTLLVIILPKTIFPHALISLKFETYVKQFNYKLLFRMEEIGSSEFSAVGHYRHFRIALTRKVTQVEKIFYIPITNIRCLAPNVFLLHYYLAAY